MKTFVLAGLSAAALLALAAPASAATVFTSTFDDVAVPDHGYINVSSVDGWTGGPYGIELQDNVAGAPASGLLNDNFVELDTTQNSSMFRSIAVAGDYDLSFLYSPRPGISAASNGIEVLLDGVLLSPGVIAQNGGASTNWSTITTHFTANAGSVLTFAATGTSDSLGGYVDNITLKTGAVPEPTTWAMMIFGFFGLGAALRRSRATPAMATA